MMQKGSPARLVDELREMVERLKAEKAELMAQLEEATATLDAISAGEVDALVVNSDEGPRIYTLQGADYPYRLMVESINEGVATIRKDGTILYCNRALADLVKHPLERVLGSTFFHLLPDDEKVEFSSLAEKGYEGHARAEFHLVSSTGEPIPVLVTAGLAEVDGRRGVCLVVTDLSEQQQANERERELQDSLTRQRDDERVRIARDLHDGPLQELIGLSYEVHLLITGPDQAANREDLLKIFKSLQNLIIELRDVSNELRPDHTIRFGLAKAIRYRVEELQSKNQNLEIRLDLTEDGYMIPHETRSALFYIFQECMNNIFRHARATRVEVRLILGDRSILLEVQDDGVGLQLPEHWVELSRNGHLGLVGMRERAEGAGGQLRVLSDDIGGTTIQVEVPCEVCNQPRVHSDE